jgi:hypothetical protein
MKQLRVLFVLGLVLAFQSFLLAQEGKAPAEQPGMEKIFNGKDLSNWDGDPRLWSVKDGMIVGKTTKEVPAKGNTFLIWKGGELADFELRLSARIGGTNNSGIQYRSKHVTDNKDNKWVVAGYQVEVEDDGNDAGFLYHEKGRGRIANVGEKVVVGEDGKPKIVGQVGKKEEIANNWKKGDWNEYVIIAKGNHLQHFINGVQTVDIVDNDPKGSLKSGILALQLHAGAPMTVEFKDIRLKHLGGGSK